MRVLIVAMSESTHTARWLSQIADQGWDVHLFPSIDYGIVHPEMKNITVYHSFYGKQGTNYQNVKFRGLPLFYNPAAILGRMIIKKIIPSYRAIQLKRLIDKIKPDIIHSLEIQNAGYLTLEAKKLAKNKFPPWIVTNWGSDIYLYGRLSEHKPRIREVLAACNYYSCECERDVRLAKAYGFQGKVLPVFPNTGGFDLEFISRLRKPGLVSERRLVMLKGYQHWAGRALVGLRALERCADLLKGYIVVIYSPSDEVLIAAELFTNSTGIPTRIVPLKTPHEEILSLHGQARISIGLSISDAISTSLLEAMVMGSFPLQSWTACADGWIEDGKTGILVPPEDPEVVEQAVRRALTDDELVNQAAERNYHLAAERLDQSILKPKAIDIYNVVAKEKGVNNEN
jgi:glycosyltransferase involved in cell wall biosynthesis